jgi:hypothetical protein
MGVISPFDWNHGGESSRAGWIVNITGRGADGHVGSLGITPCAMDYTASRPDDTTSVFQAITAKRHITSTDTKDGGQSKREKAQLMSKMLRSLLDELDAEFNVRRDEWNKVHEILSVKVKRLQNSIQLAQRVTTTTVAGFEAVLRAVLLRSAFCTWDMSHCQFKIRARVKKNVEWWFKDVTDQDTAARLQETALTWWKLWLFRRKRLEQIAPVTYLIKDDGTKVVLKDVDKAPPDAKLEIKDPIKFLRKRHTGMHLMLRWAFVAWRLAKLKASACSKGLGSALAIGPNAARLRKLLGRAWLRLARMKITKFSVLDGIIKRRIRGILSRLWHEWHVRIVRNRNRSERVEHLAQVRSTSKWVVTCFHMWARQAWTDSTEAEVNERVKKCNEVRKEQERIWKLRVAELENAIIEAKRAKLIREEHSKKIHVTQPTPDKPEAPPQPLGGGFFRQPRSEISADAAKRSMNKGGRGTMPF